MNRLLMKYDDAYFLVGRCLLGLYFLLPGILKITDYANTQALMVAKSVPAAALLLPLTIVLQIGLGLMLIFGRQLRISALLLFGLTLLISVFIHDFWNLSAETGKAHELQNFVKNLGIAAGLLVLASKQGHAPDQIQYR